MLNYETYHSGYKLKIYVGRLAEQVTEDDLHKIFEHFGIVNYVCLIKDTITKKSEGFGFVDMPDEIKAWTAINALDGKQLKGQIISVHQARKNLKDRRRSGRRGGRRENDPK